MGHTNTDSHFSFFFIDLNCTGSEESIFKCPNNAPAQLQLTCPYSYEVVVACHGNTVLYSHTKINCNVHVDYQVEYSNCTNGQVRLSGGDIVMEGRVEICYGNVWFGVCADTYYNYNQQRAVCVALGYSFQGAYEVCITYFIIIDMH